MPAWTSSPSLALAADGFSDLAVPNVDNRTVSVLLHDGDTAFLPPTTLPAGQDAFVATGA